MDSQAAASECPYVSSVCYPVSEAKWVDCSQQCISSMSFGLGCSTHFQLSGSTSITQARGRANSILASVFLQ